jgi:hypothetical protein
MHGKNDSTAQQKTEGRISKRRIPLTHGCLEILKYACTFINYSLVVTRNTTHVLSGRPTFKRRGLGMSFNSISPGG